MKQSGPPGNAESQQELKPQELPPLHHGKENEQLQKALKPLGCSAGLSALTQLGRGLAPPELDSDQDPNLN